MSLASNIISKRASNEFDSLINKSGEEVQNVIGHASKKDSAGRTLIRPKTGLNSFIKGSPILEPLKYTNGMIFPYRPIITWQSNVSYGTENLTHSIQDFKYFIKNNSTTFNISGTFTCENNDTAAYTLACFHFLRSVSKMHFGGVVSSGSSSIVNPSVQSLIDTLSLSDTKASKSPSSDNLIGTPPALLTFSTYGDYMINNLPTILESFSMALPDDVDYVKYQINGSYIDLPVITTINMTLTTQNTPQKCREFSYNDFKSGDLVKRGGWF